ncbi:MULTISPECIES: response regulator transcription factor [Aerococcus]|uniref:Response regulator transcription factor n=1 Tax=Aerococcus sanguinicola TaxID=119206 RepID=A0A5N1GNA6_9LACT|nr:MULTISPECIES: response regulator transcription factor [Aerococcus]KAA9302282.1 response regulator transcription factor [Aerococcus sanguinicola]MDK6369036.1 response regulator transcription factor [Aerococcus sp. UMB9870]MDK6678938.1 response regulator transcription factor [Aerococcus sp. UMB8608]MDK6686529.1 response regulator transcription factor [Aerococcus sp. UMB8623]MDK6939597.1 response regulator transcription factor [Aerococcus sp. UMB8487]
MKKVLIVDDEASIRKLLQFNLEKEGYEVTTAEDGNQGYELGKSNQFDLIILDIMLPGIDGMEICRRLRQKSIETAILMLTAKDQELEKIIGLELGADDYMTKPFSPREVLARMKAILRRSTRQADQEAKSQAEAASLRQQVAETASPVQADDLEEDELVKVGDIVINTGDFSVTVRGQVVDMTPKEFDLLYYMSKRVNRTLSREQLLQKIWDFDYPVETRIVDVHISHLREKIEEDTKKPQYIKTVRGFGYKFEVPKP